MIVDYGEFSFSCTEMESGIQPLSRSLERKKLQRNLRSLSNFRNHEESKSTPQISAPPTSNSNLSIQQQQQQQQQQSNPSVNQNRRTISVTSPFSKSKLQVESRLAEGGVNIAHLSERRLDVSYSWICTEIQPFLYIGSKFSAIDQKWIVKNNIKVIITIGTTEDYHEDSEILYRELNIRHIILEVTTRKGYANILKHFGFCFSIIDASLAQQEGILVHCHSGNNKSAAFIIGYLMERRNMSFSATHQLLLQKRAEVRLDTPFETQLHVFDTYRELKHFTAYVDSKIL